MSIWVSREVEEKLERLELPFNSYGLDKYGISRDYLAVFYSALGTFYRSYFRVESHGIEHVPSHGRALLAGNHSGGLPIDAGMVIASLFLDHEPPRHAHSMVEYFANQWPFISQIFSRLGQLTGVPEHAERFLNEDRLVVVFPEGARGTGKLYKDRYKLVRFGTGFVRLAMATKSPIVPFAFIGGEEAIPTMFHLKRLAKLIGAPYVPVPAQIIPWPLPIKCHILYGEPISFEGSGTENDAVILENVDTVKAAVRELIDRGLALRQS